MKIKVKLFDIYVFLIALLKGFGLDSGDLIYFIAFVIGCAAIATKMVHEKYLLSISDANKDDFDAMFASKNIDFTKSVMYRTVSNDFTPEEGFDYDMLVFFSPNGIASLQKNFPDFEQGEIAIATLGKTTAQAVKDAGLRLDIEAPTPQAPSITAAIEAYLKESNKKK